MVYRSRHATKLPSDSERFYWIAKHTHQDLENFPADIDGKFVSTDGRRLLPIDPEEMYDGRVEEERDY